MQKLFGYIRLFALVAITFFIFLWRSDITCMLQHNVYEDYRHPFAVRYLGTSILALYLLIAFFKDWLVKHLRGRYYNSIEGQKGFDKSSVELNSPVKHDEKHGNFQIEHQAPLPQECVINFCTKEEGSPLVSRNKDITEAPKKDRKLIAKEIIAFGFCMASIWFVIEV
ncbi:hypothetical protein CRYUN_Cryun26dG0085500 [Craigia yunnanensis]